MALTPTRILLGVAAACAVIAAAYLPPSGQDAWETWRSQSSAERDFANRMRGNLWRGRQALTVLEFRDSALARAATFDSRLDLYIDPGIPRRLAEGIRQQLRDSLAAFPADPAVPVMIGVFLDSMRTREGMQALPPRRMPLTHYFVPDHAPSPCLIITAIGSDIRSHVLSLQPGDPYRVPYSFSTLLGPCRYLAHRGYPGDRMRDWIRQGMVESDPIQAARCARGETPACDALLFRSPNWLPSPWGTERFSLRGGAGGGQVPGFAGNDIALLAALEDSLDAAVLDSLWTATEPIPAVFERLAGISLAEWYAELVEPDPEFQPQPAVHLPADRLAQSLVLCVVALGLAGAIASRRQV